jgi:hypothetical protein
MWGIFLGGILATGLLDAATSSNASAQRAGGVFSLAGTLMQKIVDPSIPAIAAKSTPSSGSSSSNANNQPAPPGSSAVPGKTVAPAPLGGSGPGEPGQGQPSGEVGLPPGFIGGLGR